MVGAPVDAGPPAAPDANPCDERSIAATSIGCELHRLRAPSAASSIGCEYFPTVTANPVLGGFRFAVAIANPASTPTEVTIEGGALAAPVTLWVAPRDVVVQRIPWVLALKACPGGSECGPPQNTGTLAARGAYHLRSTKPVVVYQFNPLDYVMGLRLSQSTVRATTSTR